MTDGIAAVSSAYVAVVGRQTVQSLSGATGVTRSSETVPLDDIVLSRSSGHIASLGRTQSRQLLFLAAVAGEGIVQGLKVLKAVVETAQPGVFPPSYDKFNANGATRISALNIGAQVAIFLDGIDRLVAQSGVGTVNLISSDSFPIRLQTTKHGGQLDVSVQPFDTTGLGLTGLNLLADGGIDAAVEKITAAIGTAETRLDRILTLQRFLDDGSISSQAVSRLRGGYGASALPRGSLVDLVG